MLGRTDSRRRMALLLLVFIFMAGIAAVRLGYWQVSRPDLAAKALARMTTRPVDAPARAPILDRDGDVLALSATVDQLEVHPVLIRPEQRAGIIGTLTPILDLEPWQQEAYLATLSSGAEWDYLERRLTRKQSLAISAAQARKDLPGISLRPQEVRRYPASGGQGGTTTLGSHLVGIVTGDGRGAYGVEAFYDAWLRGEEVGDGAKVNPDVASLVGVSDAGADIAAPLRLTVDSGLQRQVEKELNATLLATGAKSVSAILMDPHTGEILASASAPGYDANDYTEVQRLSQLRDPVVSDVFEPGSVMKIFTAAAALDRGAVTPATRIKDVPRIRFHKHAVRNSDWKGMGLISVKDVVAYSRNVGITKVAGKLAPGNTDLAARRLFEFWQKVGLVGRTGVDIAGEESGIWCDPSAGCDWAPVDLSNRAFGQGIGVTLVQLATGYATLINGGFRVQPHVAADGEAAALPPERVLRPKIAKQATEILVHVTGAVPWYADDALIPGYLTGGKTGTAQIWDNRKGDWKKDPVTKRDVFNHNFVGFVGRNKPEVLIALRIEEPDIKVRGQGDIEVKVQHDQLFQVLARAAIRHLGIRKSKDPEAGLPILGTQAAKVLTPERNKVARKQSRNKARAGDRSSDGSGAGRQVGATGDADATDGAARAADRSSERPASRSRP